VRLREGGDSGKPLVISDPDASASEELLAIAAALPPVTRSLVGRRLNLLT
jgi:ATP-binding protein involved in chromosome partitioning